MKHVLDTLTEYRDTYKDLIDNNDVETLPIHLEKYDEYSKAIKSIDLMTNLKEYIKNKYTDDKLKRIAAVMIDEDVRKDTDGEWVDVNVSDRLAMLNGMVLMRGYILAE